MSLIQKSIKYVAILVFFTSTLVNSSPRRADIINGPNGINPYLTKSISKKNLLNRNTVYPWSILLHKKNKPDTLNIIVLRVDFQPDSSENTTGNGAFGIGRAYVPTKNDKKELLYYTDGTYKYDLLPHDKEYLHSQLEFVQNYFNKVSRGLFHIEFSIFPTDTEYASVKVKKKMASYSPGSKKPEESWDEYYYRRTAGLMEFVNDAIKSSENSTTINPFSNLIDSGGVLIDSNGHKTAILIVHAGASFWTDGGNNGAFGQNSPSDMIDAFVTPDYFEYFKDSVSFDSLINNQTQKNDYGILVSNSDNKPILINEVMMVSETSNQDSLNWGIHGLLVNQIARQIGIPDLHSNQSEVGAFCIMDIAGYSAGHGFIPPWPSAWVRAFMGWDSPVIADLSDSVNTFNIKAVSSAKDGDTTILLVPINNHEYYLIENRQRSIFDNNQPLNYDTIDADANVCMPVGTRYISPYDPVKLDTNNIDSVRGISHVIVGVKNFDVSIPASGVLIWHVDENLIRDRLEHNILNSDSIYKAVSIVEADGINDLGIMFQDVFSQAAFDYGGAEDVFPHRTVNKPLANSKNGDCGTTVNTVMEIGPFTSPNTKSNDGGHTYLTITIDTTNKQIDTSNIRGYMVNDFIDSVFKITIRKNNVVTEIPGWPKHVIPSNFFEPVLCNIYDNGDTMELAVLDSVGRLYVWLANGSKKSSLGDLTDSLAILTLQGDSTKFIDTVYNNSDSTKIDTIISRYNLSFVKYLKKIQTPVSFPTTIKNELYIPSHDSGIIIIQKVINSDSSNSVVTTTLNLPSPPTSSICNYADSLWAVGCENGDIVFGIGHSISSTIKSDNSSNTPITAIALLDTTDTTICAIHSNGVLVTAKSNSTTILKTFLINGGTAPFTIVTADLNQLDTNHNADIVICDNTQAIWLVKNNNTLELAEGWTNQPLDWANSYASTNDKHDRTQLPRNPSSPALADINGDGTLDIILGGTNGIYVLNYNGVPLQGWPSYLDNQYWYQRKSIVASPSVALNPKQTEPLLLFSSPTGDNVTFTVAKIIDAQKNSGKILYSYGDSLIDSISGLSEALIDTLLILGDSLILPYITPGGHIDAMNTHGSRPDTLVYLNNIGSIKQSSWPITVGGTIHTSPLLGDIDNDQKTDMFAVANTGEIYRYEFSPSVLSNSFIWSQTGFNGSRVFAYLGKISSNENNNKELVNFFYNRPNPTRGVDSTAFRYKFSKPVTNVNLDIYTITGYHVLSDKNIENNYPGSSEHVISLLKFGPGIYRCRLEALVNGKKYTRYWKMAVVK